MTCQKLQQQQKLIPKLTDVRLDSADLLLRGNFPYLGHSDHGAGVHDPVAEGVRVVPAHGIHPPVRGSAARRSQHQQVGE